MGNLIVKDNALIEASHRLGEAEQRLILLAILKARSQCNTVEQLQGKELIIHADDYIKTFDVDRTTAYKVLKKAVLGLFEAKWGYKFINEKGLTQVAYRRFIQSVDYADNGAVVHFKFADDTIPLLMELERRFTVYEIEQVAQLSSQYAMRLYEFFMRHLDKKTGKGWLDISLDDLRFRFGLLPNEYKTMSNFKAYVLDFSLKQINENTDLSATYTQKKQGRVIVGFHFEFFKRTKKTQNETDEAEDLSAEKIAIIEQSAENYIAQLIEKGKQVSDTRRKNIHKKALKEKWGLPNNEVNFAEEENKKLEKKKLKEQKEREKQEQETQQKFLKPQLEKDFLVLLEHAEKFVEANKSLLTTAGLKFYAGQKNYNMVMYQWHDDLTDYKKREHFNLVYEILGGELN